VGLAEPTSRWAVNAWALGIITENELQSESIPKVLPVESGTQPVESSTLSSDGTVTLKEMVVDPAAYSGRTVHVRRTYRHLFSNSGKFTLTQGDLKASVLFGQLPKEQRAMVLREQEAKGRTVLVEGVAECDGDPEISATLIFLNSWVSRFS